MLTAHLGCITGWPPQRDMQPVDRSGYEIERLPVVANAAYARGDKVYLGLKNGEIVRLQDQDLAAPWSHLGSPFSYGANLVFASSEDVLFVSSGGQPLYRSEDDGQSWKATLDTAVWRMDEDDEGSLYAGNYTKDAAHCATLYKSTDAGLTWATVFRDSTNHHVHTVRWDDRSKVLYIAFGDGDVRGQARSLDRGATFEVLAAGPDEGHTDVAFTRDFVFWCSDDQSGRVFRVQRDGGATEELLGGSQFIWFGVSDGGDSIYVGTMTSQRWLGQCAALMGSHDQGRTWQKLLETEPSFIPGGQSFYGDSRELSSAGWLYVTGMHGPELRSYRVRRAP